MDEGKKIFLNFHLVLEKARIFVCVCVCDVRAGGIEIILPFKTIFLTSS